MFKSPTQGTGFFLFIEMYFLGFINGFLGETFVFHPFSKKLKSTDDVGHRNEPPIEKRRHPYYFIRCFKCVKRIV
jgi:hypothetical protein